jgi:hypothetical protein
MSDYKQASQTEPRWRIDGLHEIGSYTVINSEAGAGATTMAVNLLKSLADGEPFLGQRVNGPAGRIAYWNLDDSAASFESLIRQTGVAHDDRVVIANLAERIVPLYNDVVAARVINWLRSNDVECWIIDSGSTLQADCENALSFQAVSESLEADGWSVEGRETLPHHNVTAYGGALVAQLKHIKEAAGVADLWVVVRAEAGEHQ